MSANRVTPPRTAREVLGDFLLERQRDRQAAADNLARLEASAADVREGIAFIDGVIADVRAALARLP